MIAAAPSSSSGSPATSTPSSATTPATPISRPTRRMPVARSAWSNQIAITATVSGRDAIRIAVSDDETCCSPKLISGNGTTTSANAKAASAPTRLRSPLSAPSRQAIGSSTAAASTTRPHATNAGDSSSTASLMNRYGIPQRTETAANRAQARALIVDTGCQTVSVAETRIPVVAAAVGRVVEQVPHGIDRVGVARVLAGVGRREEELRSPEVADRVALTAEHVQHRELLGAVGRLAVVVAVVGVAGRREQSQPAPSARVRMGEDARQLGPRDDHDVDPLAGVLDDAVERVEELGARGAGPVVVGCLREHEVVDGERVLAGGEQLGEPHLGRRSVLPGALE